MAAALTAASVVLAMPAYAEPVTVKSSKSNTSDLTAQPTPPGADCSLTSSCNSGGANATTQPGGSAPARATNLNSSRSN
jgi:hypothetical protein